MNPPPNQRRDDSFQRWVCFELAGQCYGLDILKVKEVLADAEVEPVPGAPRPVLGVVNLRGSIVTVIDLRDRLGLTAPEQPLPLCIVVVDGPGEPVGLKVDRVVDVRAIARGAVKAAPRTSQALASAVSGVFSRNGQVLTLLDAEALVAVLVPAEDLVA